MLGPPHIHSPLQWRRTNAFGMEDKVEDGRERYMLKTAAAVLIQLIGETRQPIPPEPGKPERYDCEYRRNGTANLFVFLDAHRPWREVKVTDQRTAADFARCMRDLVETHYADAMLIRVVLCMKPSPRQKRIACCNAWNSITPPNTPVGSTWSRSRLVCCGGSA